MPHVPDAIGVPIEVGDTVVYAVYARQGGLQIGHVRDLIPFASERRVLNPYWNSNEPTTYGRNSVNPGLNDRWITESFTDYKVKFTEPDESYEDDLGNPRIQKGRSKTLDNSRRFAVVAKGKYVP